MMKGMKNREPSTFQHLATSSKRTWVHGNMESHLKPFPEQDYSKYRDFLNVELFELFLDDVIEYFVQESNKYALFKNCEHPSITKNEIRCFIGILILSGYKSVPNNYWENYKDIRNELVCNAMRRNIFEQILRFLHCADNTIIDNEDKIRKIRPLVEKFLKKYLEHFIPQQNLLYDELMVKYFGKHSFKQFIRGKPV
ncbi:hypothetical protein PR048_000717 [Dryococelus australis]|uniref:PiggyBac transposable element-derived protein domain-containing protein n=1 Tax=Dryococelus australis TaxID=614101 RepID=A0ABQ9IFE1_9NEOP|nr:hypothetical protein PR048_000717 [Dryococelus australis]